MKFFHSITRAVLTCAAVSAALLTSASAWADSTPDQAYALYTKAKAGDQAALGTLRVEAEKGNPAAQNSLGTLYANGQSVARDYSQAAQWFRKAAEQGNAKAQRNLGISYAFGQGVEQDYRQAAQWFRKAAEQFRTAAQRGQADAQYELARLYASGYGVEQDSNQAALWYRKAADQGNADAQNSLGALYAQGQGVPRDQGQSLQWYRKAAQQGQADAQNRLGYFYSRGQTVPRNYVAAYALYSLAAAQDSAGNNSAARERDGLTANMKAEERVAAETLIRKMSVPGNLLKALDEYVAAQHSDDACYRKAAQQGDANALACLGAGYERGEGVPQNMVLAYALYTLSAQKDPTDGLATRRAASMPQDMTAQQIEAGNELVRKMSVPGDLFNALDEYLAAQAAALAQAPAVAPAPAPAPIPASALPPQEEVCKLPVPPEGIYPEDIGHVLVFIYPKIVPSNYTGCQTVWGKYNGIKQRTVIYFKDGVPAKTEEYKDNKLQKSCQIKKKEEKAESGNDESACPDYDEFKKMEEGLRAAKPYRGEVPPEIDPRK